MQFEVKNGCFAYPEGREVLKNINFRFDCRGIMSVLGRNGAGKTTLLRCMLGLQKWTAGATLIDGIDAARMKQSEFWSRIGYVPQAKAPSFAYTVEENVVLGRSAHLGMFAQPRPKDLRIAREAMERVGIAHLAGKLCNQISGGEYQLSLVARALAGEPELLILDEPESNLDYKNQLRVLRVLQQLSEKEGIGSIINTHYPAHALEISTESLVMFPDGTHLFGDTGEVLTDENLSKSFGVDVRIVGINLPERPNYQCVIAVDE